MTRAAKLSWKGGGCFLWVKKYRYTCRYMKLVLDLNVEEIEMFSWWTGNIELRIGKYQFTHSVQTHAFGICMAPYFRADYRHTVEIILEGRKFSHIFTCLCECMETCIFSSAFESGMYTNLIKFLWARVLWFF